MIESIGKYRIVRELGRGGMGIVYLATDEALGREVALKIIRPGFHIGDRALERFKREARAAAGLLHPHVAHINAFHEFDAQLVIEMPYLSGGSFKDRVRSGMSIGSLARVLDEMLQALECCHAAGIIHRDVKPSNILFDDFGTAKLSDFGAATLAAEELSASVSSDATTFIGTPRYACPEAWEQDAPTPQWDLYALGVVAWEALAGELPNAHLSPLAFLRDRYESPLPAIHEKAPEVSEELGDLIDALCTRDPHRRPQSAEEARERLYEAPESSGVGSDLDRTATLRRPKRNYLRLGFRDRVTQTLKRTRPYTLPVGVSFIVGVLFAAWWSMGSTATVESPTETRPFVSVLQSELVAGSIPDAQALLTSVRMAPPYGTRVYDLLSSRRREAGNHLLLGTKGEQGVRPGLAVVDGTAIVLRLSSGFGEIDRVSGIWGTYRDARRKALLVGTVTGSAVPWGADRDLLRFDLEFESETTGDRWNESLVASPADDRFTDTAVVYGWERDPVILPVLMREMLPRHAAFASVTDKFLPALRGSAIRGHYRKSLAAVERDGVLSEEIWRDADVVYALPRNAGATMQIVASDSEFVLGIDWPLESDPGGTRLEGCFLPGYDVPRARSPRLEWKMEEDTIQATWIAGDDRRSVSHLVSGRSVTRNDSRTFEITIPHEAIARSTPPHPQDRYRIHLAIRSLEDNENLLVWGWPEPGAVAHGVVLTFAGNAEVER